jgi:hypothetical protein
MHCSAKHSHGKHLIFDKRCRGERAGAQAAANMIFEKRCQGGEPAKIEVLLLLERFRTSTSLLPKLNSPSACRRLANSKATQRVELSTRSHESHFCVPQTIVRTTREREQSVAQLASDPAARRMFPPFHPQSRQTPFDF